MDKIAVLIPCYNEEQTIGAVIEDFARYVPYAELYVYDNNSTDKTAEIAKSYADRCKVFVKRAPKQGKGNVVKQMFSEIDADIYVLVDGDTTYHAADVMELVTGIQTGYDMIIGNRQVMGSKSIGKRKFHLFGNRFVDKYVRKLYGGNITDVMSGYRAFSRKFVKGINIQSTGFEIETELCIYALKNRLSVKCVPISYTDRPDGSESKLDTFMDGLRVLEVMYRLR